MPKVDKNRKSARLTPEDKKIIAQLTKKLGVGYSQIMRLAIRKLAEHEGLRGSAV